jgi:hypothetical protein
MRKLLLAALIALVGFLPVMAEAQTPPAPAAAQTAGRADDTNRVLAVGLGAVTGMVLLSVISANMISSQALANLGQGVVVFTGTVVGGLAGNWLYNR